MAAKSTWAITRSHYATSNAARGLEANDRTFDVINGFREDTEQKGPSKMAKGVVQRIKRKLPDRIAQVRGDRSQRQFARDLGVFQQNVNRYENGTTPHTDFLITLATKENVSLDWLLLGQGRMRRGR
jgi:DNA-binding transcriptional regulator YiaG